MNCFEPLKHQKTLSLEEAAFRSFQRLSSEKVLFVDDNTIYSKFYHEILKTLKINCDIYTPTDLRNTPRRTDSVLFIPAFEFRITNVNYNRTLNEEYGKPYFVHYHSNKYALIKEHYLKTFKECISHPLVEFPALLRAYLLNPPLTDWLSAESLPLPHNDSFDRQLIQNFLIAREVPFDSTYQVSSQLGTANLLQSVFQQLPDDLRSRSQLQHYPLHRIYLKYLSTDLSINQLERSIYGNVDL